MTTKFQIWQLKFLEKHVSLFWRSQFVREKMHGNGNLYLSWWTSWWTFYVPVLKRHNHFSFTKEIQLSLKTSKSALRGSRLNPQTSSSGNQTYYQGNGSKGQEVNFDRLPWTLAPFLQIMNFQNIGDLMGSEGLMGMTSFCLNIQKQMLEWKGRKKKEFRFSGWNQFTHWLP